MSQPLTTKQQLIELFNTALAQSGNTTTYLEADLTFDVPVAYEEGTVDTSEVDSNNTHILVTTGEGLEQVSFRLHYHRLGLAHLASLRAGTFDGEVGANSVHDLLLALELHLEYELTVDDVEDLPLTPIDADSATVTLRAKPTSLAVQGETTLIVTGLAV